MDYPIKFESCPNCGSTERFGEIETQEEIKKGNLLKDSRTAIMLSKTMIFNPEDKRVLLFRKQVPVLVGVFDVCCSCGTLYCISMDKGTAVIEPQLGKNVPPGNNTPPFFGKG